MELLANITESTLRLGGGFLKASLIVVPHVFAAHVMYCVNGVSHKLIHLQCLFDMMLQL